VADSVGNIFVSDAATIRKLTTADGTNWVVATIAGLPGTAGSADGTNNGARFSNPDGITIDGAGRLFVADEFNNLIREVIPVGTNWVVTTIAKFPPPVIGQGPSALMVDTNDNLYLAGQALPAIYRMTADGTNWLPAPVAGYNVAQIGQGTNDGTGIAARFHSPHGITMDTAGNLFVVDNYGNIRKGWSSNVLPETVLDSPMIGGGQVRLNFAVTTGAPTNFTLLQADAVTGPWTTNPVAQLITNIAGLSYELTLPLTNGSAEFYRLQQQ
jgi:secreted PhoX family phosphatase